MQCCCTLYSHKDYNTIETKVRSEKMGYGIYSILGLLPKPVDYPFTVVKYY